MRIVPTSSAWLQNYKGWWSVGIDFKVRYFAAASHHCLTSPMFQYWSNFKYLVSGSVDLWAKNPINDVRYKNTRGTSQSSLYVYQYFGMIPCNAIFSWTVNINCDLKVLCPLVELNLLRMHTIHIAVRENTCTKKGIWP